MQVLVPELEYTDTNNIEFIFFQSPPIPYKAIMTSLPFFAILIAHMGQNYGYETLMTELPTYMKQVLRFSIKEVSMLKNVGSTNKITEHVYFFICLIEWCTISFTVLGNVVFLDVICVCCRLDDLFESLYTHGDEKNSKQYWAVWSSNLFDCRFLHGLQPSINGGTTDSRCGSEWWYLFGF
jgi:hypothetical protein